MTPDFTRNGVATGYVVVPEFPSPIIAILVGSVLGILIVIERSMFKGTAEIYMQLQVFSIPSSSLNILMLVSCSSVASCLISGLPFCYE